MDGNKERKLENIRQDLASLVERLDVIEKEMAGEENRNWMEVMHEFIVENDGTGTITIAVDTSGSMIEHKHLAYLLVREALQFNNRVLSLICFSDTIELYTKYLQSPEITSILFGGDGDLLELFEYLERNEIENPLIIFGNGTLYPTGLSEVSRLSATIREYDFPMVYIFPSKTSYKEKINSVSQALDCVNIAFMTE